MSGYLLMWMTESLIPEISEIIFRTREEAELHFDEIMKGFERIGGDEVIWWDIRRVVVMS
mgnify:FL=1|jgi:hypothetical protein|tara:strand:+ start:157 stop:336 length:180 start_codon:yes stop_codon:yes gene_type:complete